MLKLDLGYDKSWIQVGGIIVSIIVLTITIYQFNETQTNQQKLQFIEHLEFYQNEYSELYVEFNQSPKKFGDCQSYISNHVGISDKILYLKSKEFIPPEFLEYFNNNLSASLTGIKWLEYTNKSNLTYKDTYVNFRSEIEFIDDGGIVRLPAMECLYFIEKINENIDYDPRNDDMNVDGFSPSYEDVRPLVDFVLE